jgi:hypothetical protein
MIVHHGPPGKWLVVRVGIRDAASTIPTKTAWRGERERERERGEERIQGGADQKRSQASDALEHRAWE